jgi:hypothetical protein
VSGNKAGRPAPPRHRSLARRQRLSRSTALRAGTRFVWAGGIDEPHRNNGKQNPPTSGCPEGLVEAGDLTHRARPPALSASTSHSEPQFCAPPRLCLPSSA